jgi:hypothetical protein
MAFPPFQSRCQAPVPGHAAPSMVLTPAPGPAAAGGLGAGPPPGPGRQLARHQHPRVTPRRSPPTRPSAAATAAASTSGTPQRRRQPPAALRCLPTRSSRLTSLHARMRSHAHVRAHERRAPISAGTRRCSRAASARPSRILCFAAAGGPRTLSHVHPFGIRGVKHALLLLRSRGPRGTPPGLIRRRAFRWLKRARKHVVCICARAWLPAAETCPKPWWRGRSPARALSRATGRLAARARRRRSRCIAGMRWVRAGRRGTPAAPSRQ